MVCSLCSLVPSTLGWCFLFLFCIAAFWKKDEEKRPVMQDDEEIMMTTDEWSLKGCRKTHVA